MKTKFLALVMLLGIANVAQADSNGVYIDQIGNQGSINVTQTGAGNSMQGLGSGLAVPLAKIHDDNTTVAISQIGAGNSLLFGLDSGPSGSTNQISYSISGSNNVATINCNDSGSAGCDHNRIIVNQLGDNNATSVTMTGAHNQVSYTTDRNNGNQYVGVFNGDNITSVTNITNGGGNQVNISSTPTAGTGAEADVAIAGASNIVGITQSGGAVMGNYASLTLNGTGNNVTVSQTGTVADNILRVTSTGSNNVMRFTQTAR